MAVTRGILDPEHKVIFALSVCMVFYSSGTDTVIHVNVFFLASVE